MSMRRGGPMQRRRVLLTGVLVAACAKSPARSDDGDERSLAPLVDAGSCLGAALRPSSAPPDAGLWLEDGATNGSRVSATIGPAEMPAGAARITRAIETRERGGGRADVRIRLDTAVVTLDLLPPYRDGAVADADAQYTATRSPVPAAVYALSTTVLIAAYEGCSERQPPAVRYLRRDARGRIVTDAMLRHQSN